VCASGPQTPDEEGWIDISVPLRSGMVHWPDNPPVRIERMPLDATIGRARMIEIQDLISIKPDELAPHELICLPLKVEDGDGATARAILRK
jgi:kynurenine formamidase